VERLLLDTSLLIAPPASLAGDSVAVSVLSLAELERGVLVAATAAERGRRLDLLDRVRRTFQALPFDESAAHEYAILAATAREAGRSEHVIDMQIAATARANGLALATCDRRQAELLDGSILLAQGGEGV
jgi:predicted nucleic acid-binding protein